MDGEEFVGAGWRYGRKTRAKRIHLPVGHCSGSSDRQEGAMLIQCVAASTEAHAGTVKLGHKSPFGTEPQGSRNRMHNSQVWSLLLRWKEEFHVL